MDHHEIPHFKRDSLAESALNGVVNGLLAGVTMALYVLLAGMVVADSDWAYVSYLDLAHSGSPWQTVFTQLALSALFGAAFGIFCYWSRIIQDGLLPAWLAGMAYGMVLWALAVALILPRDQFTLNPLATVYLLFAYLIFGLILGLRQKSRVPTV